MKILLTIATLINTFTLFAQQTDSLLSAVYYWKNQVPVREETGIMRRILKGKTFALEYFEVHAATIDAGNTPQQSYIHNDQEELMIIKEGQLRITIAGKSKTLGPGSIAFVTPGDEHLANNSGNSDATFFILKFKGKLSLDSARAKQPGTSFMLDWKDLKITNTGKGYRRDFFDKTTTQLGQFEMHTTALNADSVSHAPHTHVQEEIILILRGKVEMFIDGKYYKGSEGDLYFLSSNTSHALKNIGKEQCEYFAFQWRN
jgi:(S)-ureidoglycine aminohydrolase